MVEITLIYIIVLILSAVLGIQIANESTLALSIKNALRLSQPYSKSVHAFSKFTTWWVLVPRWFVIALPIIAIIVLVLRTHHFISNLLDCSRCTATWIFAILQYFVLDVSLLYAILFAPLAIVGVYLLERLEG